MEYEHGGLNEENREQPFPLEQHSVVVVNEGGPPVKDDDDPSLFLGQTRAAGHARAPWN